ncbi:GNAT family N-acetyltransferase [Streptomyces lichenis]|uniref:GNAT family N-acetyltransferase n=1 Tax=Streptomyces lichenis TaxID=2306967 RepID=A0ABT0IHP9_9ACTN|nr:GNAT family N-acetyltransferase [Streptomyces lichenis]MCK8680860.1 GNAT family N-acetyltransferase [Streptomyces lichenis]
MTTTLRPTGPLQQSDDGTRVRRYEVCVNSRPVGAIELGTSARFGPAAGEIRSLRVDPPDRGRGRGTVAALAAEEVLRGWRCTSVQAAVPAGAEAARSLAAALGYRERGRDLLKALPDEPGPAPEIVVRPMTEPEFAAYLSTAREEYAREWASRGVPEERAGELSERGHRELLPHGLATEGAGLFVAVDEDGGIAGRLWTGRCTLDSGEVAGYVYDIRVAEERRGRGLGRALMGVAERVVREDGRRRLGLHVFADNAPALRLYASLGYETVRLRLYKPLL